MRRAVPGGKRGNAGAKKPAGALPSEALKNFYGSVATVLENVATVLSSLGDDDGISEVLDEQVQMLTAAQNERASTNKRLEKIAMCLGVIDQFIGVAMMPSEHASDLHESIATLI